MGLVDHLPRILVAQAARANPLYLSYQKGFEDFEPIQAEKTLASAIQIGDPVSVEKAITTLKRFDGVVEQATEQELADAVARADRTGLFCCPHTGVAFAALLKLLDRGAVGKDDRVVVISTAHGLKFTDFKVQYHRGELQDLGVDSGLANMPVELPAEYDAVRDQLYRRLEG
jgi:threonine synthase